MSHTFELHQMHCSISNYNTHCIMTYGCSNLFFSHDWVTPSRILLLVTSPSFPHSPHVCTTLVGMHKVTPPYACVNGKKEPLLRLGVYIGVLTHGKFYQTLFLPWVKNACHVYNYGYLCSINLHPWNNFSMVSMTPSNVCILRIS